MSELGVPRQRSLELLRLSAPVGDSEAGSTRQSTLGTTQSPASEAAKNIRIKIRR